MSGSMRQKVETVANWAEQGVEHSLSEFGGFRVLLRKNQAIAVPPGYLVLTYSKGGSAGMRWGFLEQSPTHMSVASETLHSFLDAYPSSRGRSMVEWERHLCSTDVT